MTTEIPVGAIDSTKALYQIVSAGFDGAEAMQVLEISAKAAVAGVTSTAIAADTLTTIINAYGLDASEATTISDQLFKTVELGKTTLAEIGASFSQVASIAAAYGVNVNEALAATAAMTKQGAPTAQAMTSIKAAIVSVTEKLGENIFKTHSFGEALNIARQKAEESGDGIQTYFGRLEAVNGVL
jgi:TP901 family phage tail tape measure protein